MAEVVVFVDSFDHAGPAAAPAKYRHAAGTYTEVPGPYHGVAARFGGRGDELGPMASGSLWDSGAWSAAVKVESAGFSGSGEVALLAAAYWDGTVDFPHHWLTVDSTGALRVRRWPVLPGAPPATEVLAASAAGALPLDAWARLEYRTQIRGTAAGALGLRVDGTEVLAAGGVITADPQRAVVRADYFRFGNLATTADDSGGVGGLGSGGAGVAVAVDDVCERHETTIGAALLADRDDPAAPHRVVCLRPTGPGGSTGLTLAGAASNWAANAEVPPDGDASTVTKPAGGLPYDRYVVAPAPALTEGAAGAALLVWGLGRSDATPARVVLGLTDGTGGEASQLALVAAAYRYARLSLGSVEGLTNAQLTGLEVGWGDLANLFSASYVGTQVVAELWYRPTEPDPEPGAGGQRWSLGWLP